MTDTTLSDALKEAYASAPSDVRIIDTIGIWWSGLATVIYFYRGSTGDAMVDGVWTKQFTIETSASVTMYSMPFDITLPNVNSDTGLRGQLSVDGVSREVAEQFLTAIESGSSVQVTYRAYLEGFETDGPQQTPIAFGLTNVSVNAKSVSGDITVPIRGNRKFPKDLYTVERFPSLGN
jgi:hypothetical protein